MNISFKKLKTVLLSSIIIGHAQFSFGDWQLITNFDDADADGNSTVNSTIVGTKVWAPDADVPGFVGGEADPSPWTGDEGNIALHVDHNNTATMGMETAYILTPD